MNTNTYKFILLFFIIIYNLKFMGDKNWLYVNWEDFFPKKKTIHMTLLGKLGRYFQTKKKKSSIGLFNNTMTLYTKNWATGKLGKSIRQDVEKWEE